MGTHPVTNEEYCKIKTRRKERNFSGGRCEPLKEPIPDSTWCFIRHRPTETWTTRCKELDLNKPLTLYFETELRPSLMRRLQGHSAHPETQVTRILHAPYCKNAQCDNSKKKKTTTKLSTLHDGRCISLVSHFTSAFIIANQNSSKAR